MPKTLRLLSLLLVLLAVLSSSLAACSRDRKAEAPAKPAKTVVPATKMLPPPRPAPELSAVSGRVLEVLEDGNHIFLLIDRGNEQSWATVPATDLKIGERISLENAAPFGKFYSNSLERTFDSLIFATGISGKSPRGLLNGGGKVAQETR